MKLLTIDGKEATLAMMAEAFPDMPKLTGIRNLTKLAEVLHQSPLMLEMLQNKNGRHKIAVIDKIIPIPTTMKVFARKGVRIPETEVAKMINQAAPETPCCEPIQGYILSLAQSADQQILDSLNENLQKLMIDTVEVIDVPFEGGQELADLLWITSETIRQNKEDADNCQCPVCKLRRKVEKGYKPTKQDLLTLVGDALMEKLGGR